jgi:hypothetical protein
MKRQSLRFLMAALCLAGLSVAVKAQVSDQIVVTIPFEFVVGGKTLPAGTYRGNRVSSTGEPFEGLVLSSFENRTSVFVLPTEVESAPTDKPQLTFEQVGSQRLLSKIQTANYVYNIKLPRAASLLASNPSNNGAGSDSAGGN